MVCVLVKMGGNGNRFGGPEPKQFYKINGKPFFAYLLKKYQRIDMINKFVIVTNRDWYDVTKRYAKEILGNKLFGVISGGETNLESSMKGILFAGNILTENDVLPIHDVTDPIINEVAINDAIKTASETGCAAVVTEQVHTLYSVDDVNIVGTIKKKTAASGYSPEAFKYGVLRNCFNEVTQNELSNMTSVVELALSRGVIPKAVVSKQLDLKITYKEDMDILVQLIDSGEKLYV